MSDTFDHEGDAWGSLDWENDGERDYHEPFTPRPVCRGCHKPFDWHHTGERWVLMDSSGRIHNCRVTAASPDEFEAVDDFSDLA